MPDNPFPRLKEILAEGPLKRSKFYQLAENNPGLVKKIDGVSIVDRAMYYEILAAAPAATFRDPKRVAAQLRSVPQLKRRSGKRHKHATENHPTT